MNEGTITKQQLADVLGQAWETAVYDMNDEQGRAVVALCKTLADEFGLAVAAPVKPPVA